MIQITVLTNSVVALRAFLAGVDLVNDSAIEIGIIDEKGSYAYGQQVYGALIYDHEYDTEDYVVYLKAEGERVEPPPQHIVDAAIKQLQQLQLQQAQQLLRATREQDG